MYYAIVWDMGSEGTLWDTYTLMTADSYFTNINGLSSGHPYRFKYKAQNIHGWGAESQEVLITAMSYPSASNVPTTQTIGANVRIDWDAPYSGGIGISISAYKILIKNANGDFVEDLDYCDGLSDQTIIDNTECFIPMAILSDATKFGLVQGNLVVAQVAAFNSKG